MMHGRAAALVLQAALVLGTGSSCTWAPNPCAIPCESDDTCPLGYLCVIPAAEDEGTCSPGPQVAEIPDGCLHGDDDDDDDNSPDDDDTGDDDDTSVSDDDDTVAADADGDGYEPPIDCDDGDPSVHPGADENCVNGIDDNCDGAVDRDAPPCQAVSLPGLMHGLCSSAGVSSNGQFTLRSCTGPAEAAPGIMRNDNYILRASSTTLAQEANP